MQAVQTNVIGTENVLNVAIEAGVKKVIVLSTDKAVYPINTMGMSKAMMEKLAISKENAILIYVKRFINILPIRLKRSFQR